MESSNSLASYESRCRVLLERRQDFPLWLAIPKRDSLCTAVTGWTAWARRIVFAAASERPKLLTFAPLDQILDGSGDILDRDVRIDTVLEIQVDRLDLPSYQRADSATHA